MTTKQWPNWYNYMQNHKGGNVRAWDGEPGPQGHWILRRVKK